ncbi:MAG: hypothetical protein HYY93_03710 [Planctomycetes bacterium]|nr:hypothetical protein [Planctomycetota bacterium]
MNPTRRVLFLSAALLFALPPLSRADLTLSAELGLGGRVRADRCTFIRVTVRNTEGRHDGAIRLSVDKGSHSVCVPLLIEGVSTKRLDIPFLVPTPRYSRIVVSYVSSPSGEGSPVGGTEVVLANPVNGRDDGRLAIVVGDAASPIAGRLKAAYDHVGVCLLLADDALPTHWSGLDAAEICVLAPSDVGRIQPLQWEALRKWTRAGGHLLLPWNASWFASEQTHLAAILPAGVESARTFETTDEVMARPFLAVGGHPLQPARILAAALSPRPDAATVIGGDAFPIAVSRPAGFGRVTLLAFDPTNFPFNAWAGMPRLWAEVFRLPPPPDPKATLIPIPEGPGPRTDPEIYSLLGRFEEARPVSLALILLFAFVYLACLGPLQVWGLRKWRRGILAASVPATMALFTALAYLIAQKPFVVGLRVHTCSVVENAPDGTASRGVLMVSLLAPSGGTHRLGAEGLDAVWGVDPRSTTSFMGSALSTRAFPGERSGISARMPVWSAAPLMAVWMEERPRGTAPVVVRAAETPASPEARVRKLAKEELGGMLLFEPTGVSSFPPWAGITPRGPVVSGGTRGMTWKPDRDPDAPLREEWRGGGYPDGLPSMEPWKWSRPWRAEELELRARVHLLEGDRAETLTGQVDLPCWNLRTACMKEGRTFVGAWSDQKVVRLFVDGSPVEGEHHVYYRVEAPR